MGKNLKILEGIDELFRKAKEEENIIVTHKETRDTFRIKYIKPEENNI